MKLKMFYFIDSPLFWLLKSINQVLKSYYILIMLIL